MHDAGREEGPATSGEGPQSGAAQGLLDEIGRAGRAAKGLFGAQWSLFIAELGLARSAISWLLLAALAATVAGVGLGLTLMALAGVLLAQWLHSWAWALVVLGVLQALFLYGMIVLFRRCMHWLTLPASRAEWRATIRQAMRRSEQRAAPAPAADAADANREEGT